LRSLSLLIVFLVSFSATASGEDRVIVCDDQEPWPPYTYPDPASSNGTEQVRIGAMVDFLDAIMEHAGLDHVINLKPWNRCLRELEEFSQPGHAEIMIGAGFNEERTAFAHFTRPTHQTTPAIFYSQEAFPNGPDWRDASDTENFVVCRVRGFDYSNVIVSEEGPTVDASSLEVALRQMSRGRCQILFSSLEPVLGSRLYGDSIAPEGITFLRYNLDEPNEYHIMVSKRSPRAEELVRILNDAIGELIEDGTRDEIFQP